MNDKSKVTTGKPKVSGAVHWAPKGTAAPTSTSQTLGDAFKDLGYVSEDGVSFENSTTSIKAWGGDTPISIREDTVNLSLMQAKDPNVLELVYGPENVTTDGTTGEITAKFAADYSLEGVFVFDMIMRGGVAKRIVVPKGSISEIGSVTYKDNEAVVYPVTIGCSPDSTGTCHYEYLAADEGETEETEETGE